MSVLLACYRGGVCECSNSVVCVSEQDGVLRGVLATSICLHMSACELVQGDEHKIAPRVPVRPHGCHRVGAQLFRRVRNFYRFTQTHQFFIGLRACEKGGGRRGGKIAKLAERAAHFGPSDARQRGGCC